MNKKFWMKQTGGENWRKKKSCQFGVGLNRSSERLSAVRLNTAINRKLGGMGEDANSVGFTNEKSNVGADMKQSKKSELIGEPVMPGKFPLEILHMIMSHLEDTTDLVNCSKADPNLDSLLTKRKPDYLFSLVFPLLIKQLGERDILKCRLVCKNWKVTVDRFILNRPANRPYDDTLFLSNMESIQVRFNRGVTAQTVFNPTVLLRSTVNSLDAFQTAYDNLGFAGKTPFLGGSVEFLVQVERDLLEDGFGLGNPQLQRLGTFLSRFGTHIQYLKITNITDDLQHQIFSFFIYLLCLALSPNLETTLMWGPWAFPRDAAEDLLSRLDNFPPNLLNLSALELIQPTSTSPLVTNFVATPYLSQLRKLTLPFWTEELQTQLPNLVELKILCLDSNKILERLVGVTAPIQKMCLYLDFCNLNMEILQRVLLQFPLCHLELSWVCQGAPIVPKTPPPSATLLIPTVHTLIITHSTNVNYSFLRWFPNLLHLFLVEKFMKAGPIALSPLSNRVMKRIANHEVVQIHKYLYTRKMSRSNVWERFKNLRFIMFQRKREWRLEGVPPGRALPVEIWELGWGRP